MISGNHSHRCRVCEKEWRCPQITHCKRPDLVVCADHDNPGTYYSDKAALAHALREAIKLIKEIQKKDSSYGYGRTIQFLEWRLDQAEYVGD